MAALVRSLTATKSMSLGAQRRAHDVAADAPEPVDPHLHHCPIRCHLRASPCRHVREADSQRNREQTSIVGTGLKRGQSRSYTAVDVKSLFSRLSVYLLYSLATLLVLVALSPYFLYQALRHKKYVGSLRQRLGYLPVSFNLDGERLDLGPRRVGGRGAAGAAAHRRAAQALSARCGCSCPRRPVSGQQLARRSVTDVDGVFYFPFDWTFTVRRTLRSCKPRLFVMVETEIWPNLLRECRAAASRRWS